MNFSGLRVFCFRRKLGAILPIAIQSQLEPLRLIYHDNNFNDLLIIIITTISTCSQEHNFRSITTIWTWSSLVKMINPGRLCFVNGWEANGCQKRNLTAPVKFVPYNIFDAYCSIYNMSQFDMLKPPMKPPRAKRSFLCSLSPRSRNLWIIFGTAAYSNSDIIQWWTNRWNSHSHESPAHSQIPKYFLIIEKKNNSRSYFAETKGS